MTSPDEFYFSLLRVSVIQLLNGVGFDKSNKQTVDTVTDLYIKYLSLLVKEIEKQVGIRNEELNDDYNYPLSGNTLALQDISQAFVNLKVIRPTDALDVYGENPFLNNDEGMDSFKNWCSKSTISHESRIISKPNVSNLLDDLLQGYEFENEDKETLEDSVPLFSAIQKPGSLDNWIKYTIKRQQLNNWKHQNLTLNNKTVNSQTIDNLENLPETPDMGDSYIFANSLARADHISSENINFIPSVDKTNSAHLPPLAQRENRLCDITLSYENAEYDEPDTKDEEEDDVKIPTELVDNNMQNNEAISLITNSISLDTAETFEPEKKDEPAQVLNLDHPLEFNDFDDMDNAFQRRDSFTDQYTYDNF